MRNAALRAFVAVAAGIAATRIPGLPWWPGLVLAGGGVCFGFLSRGWSLYLALTGAAFLLGTVNQNRQPDPQVYERRAFTGIVEEEPTSEQDRDFVVALTGSGPGRVRVKVQGQMPSLQYGDLVLIKSRINPFNYPRNPGGFDFNSYYRSQGFVGETRVKAQELSHLGHGQSSAIKRLLVMPLRRQVYRTSRRFLASTEAALFLSLFLGDKSGLPIEVQTAFRDSGTMHVLAISGLHVGILVGVVWLFLSLVQIRGWTRMVICAAVITTYMLVTGMRPPVIRAGIMAMAVLLALSLQRKAAPLASLSVAGILILFFDPQALFTPSFQLSFAAAWSILAGLHALAPVVARLRPRLIRNWLILPLLVSTAAFLGTAPLLLAHFYRVQTLSCLFSPLIIAVVSLTVPLGLVVLGLSLLWNAAAGVFAETLQVALSLLLSLVKFLGSQQWAIWEPGAVPPLFLFYFYGLLLLTANWRQPLARSGLRIGLVLGLNLIAWRAVFHQPVTRVSFLDPGQGDCMVLEDTLGQVVVLDAGVRGPQVLRDYLRYRGVRKIDLAVITHPDYDHYGGFLDLSPRCPIKQLVVPTTAAEGEYKTLLDRLRQEGTQITVVGKGSSIRGLGFGLEFLWPEDAARATFQRDRSRTNFISLVTVFRYANYRMLLTGDMEEIELLRGTGQQVDLLKSPHHGSQKGNPPEWYARLRPTRVVVMGRYPTPARLEELLADYGERYVNTRRDGAWQVEFRRQQPVFRYLTSRP